MPEPGHEVPVTKVKVPNVSLSRGKHLEGRTPLSGSVRHMGRV